MQCDTSGREKEFSVAENLSKMYFEFEKLLLCI